MYKLTLVSLISILLVSCQFSGGSGGTSTATIRSVSENLDPIGDNYPVNLLRLNGCGVTPTAVYLPTSWHVTLSDKTVADVHFLWPKGRGYTAALNIYIAGDAGRINPNLPNDVTVAVNQWASALQQYAPGTLLLSPQISSDSTSPVTVYADYNGTTTVGQNEGGNEVFGNIPTGQPVNATNLQSAAIVIASNSPAGDGGVYASALHEIGHALGLNHSVFQSSIMFPYVLTGCYYQQGVGGRGINKFDTDYLETNYDPTWVKNPDAPPGACHSKSCPQTPQKGVRLLKTYAESEHVGRESRRDYQGSGSQDELGALKFEKVHRLVSIHLDNHAQSKQVSLQSLYLGSALVAKVHILGDAAHYDSGAYTIFLRRARIDTILRHELGPDAYRRPGQVVLIEDIQSRSTKFFMDDPPLEDGTSAICFLNRTDRFGAVTAEPVYDVANKFVSKLGISSDNRLYVAGSTTSELAAQVNGTLAPAFLDTVLQTDRYGGSFRPNALVSLRGGRGASEREVLQRLLANRGLRTLQQIDEYQRSMKTSANNLLRGLKASDLLARTPRVGALNH